MFESCEFNKENGVPTESAAPFVVPPGITFNPSSWRTQLPTDSSPLAMCSLSGPLNPVLFVTPTSPQHSIPQHQPAIIPAPAYPLSLPVAGGLPGPSALSLPAAPLTAPISPFSDSRSLVIPPTLTIISYDDIGPSSEYVGGGHFAKVYKTLLAGSQVALKKPKKNPQEPDAIEKEIAILAIISG